MLAASAAQHRGFSLTEVAVALIIIAVLMSILLPGLNSARSASQRGQCERHQVLLGEAWEAYLADHERRFPVLLSQPAWQWGGARFSAVHDTSYLDLNRPLSSYVTASALDNQPATHVFRCPADDGISSDLSEAGTGRRSVYRSFGTSYRANAFLLSGRAGDGAMTRPILRDALLAAPASMVLLGDAGWYEQRFNTGRTAHWHGDDGRCNLLFLDGSVRTRVIEPDAEASAVVFECDLRDADTEAAAP